MFSNIHILFIIKLCWQHGVPWHSLSLSHTQAIIPGRSSRLDPVSTQSSGGHPALRTLLMSSSLLLQLYSTCSSSFEWLVAVQLLIWVISKIPFSMHFISFHIVHSYSSMDTANAWKKKHQLFYQISIWLITWQ